MSEAKRFMATCDCMSEVAWGDYVSHDDYAALEAECARLKNSLLAITARHFAGGWKKRTSDAELEQYLSAGIAQLEAERDALAAELAAIKGQEPVAIANKGNGVFWVKCTDAGKPLRRPGIKLYALPAAPEGGEKA